ncbi:putative phosphate ABC transporter, permease PstsS [Mycoplasma haemofelis Ohio2]|uniref:Putative phosphate ABC transporter, permease PstsS n=1 Tax=Mycoplasma haemofelis (strain Ohio2) TaxID=859194 RepID=F6FJR7_MYCHI|nr:putative phosphate ABC transporter, permease PstsS [Mycoplasma haemofelis Ohio2]
MSDTEKPRIPPFGTVLEPTQAPISKYEKWSLFLTAKPVVIGLSICTLGFYYLYYLFCLEQHTKSPFNSKEKYTYTPEPHEFPCWVENNRFNKRFAQILEGNPFLANQVQKKTKGWWIRLKIRISAPVAWFSALLERQIYKLKFLAMLPIRDFREEQMKAFLAEEKKIRDNLNKKFRSLKEDEFNDLALGNKVHISLRDNPESHISSRRYDYFVLFIFCFSYLSLSVLTLGIFPIYIYLHKKDGEFQWKNVHDQKEFINMEEFNESLASLVDNAIEEDFDYSEGIRSLISFEDRKSAKSDLYRTYAFRDHETKKWTIRLLNILTGGIFGLWVLARNAFNRATTPTSWKELLAGQKVTWVSFSRHRNKYIIRDFRKDVQLATIFASVREAKMNKYIRSHLVTGNKPLDMFLRVVSSELFKWLFTALSFFLIISVSCILGALAPWSFWFWAWLVLGISFLLLFTYHINLLFI